MKVKTRAATAAGKPLFRGRFLTLARGLGGSGRQCPMTGGGDAVARDSARGQGPGDRPGSGGRVPAGAPGNAAAGRPALRSAPVARLARDSLAVITTHRGPHTTANCLLSTSFTELKF